MENRLVKLCALSPCFHRVQTLTALYFYEVFGLKNFGFQSLKKIVRLALSFLRDLQNTVTVIELQGPLCGRAC